MQTRAVRNNRGITAPDPASRNEVPDLNPAPGQQAVLNPQDAPDQDDPPGGHVADADHAILTARSVLPIIGITLAGTIPGITTPITIVWVILVSAAIVLLVWKRSRRQRLDLRRLGTTMLAGLLEVGYASLVFPVMNHLLVGTAAVSLMTIIISVDVVHRQGKLRFLSLALALTGLIALMSQAPSSIVDGSAQQASMMASILAGLSLLLPTAVQVAVSRLDYGRGTICGVGLTIATAGFGVWDTVSGITPTLTGSFITVIVAVSFLMFIISAVLLRVDDQETYTRTVARYNAFYSAAVMVVGGVVPGQVPSALDLLGLVFVTGALWIMPGVTITPWRSFGKRGSEAMTADWAPASSIEAREESGRTRTRVQVARDDRSMNTTDPVTRTDAEWKKLPSLMRYHVLREASTKRPSTGELPDEVHVGIYSYAACESKLFNSDTKFDSSCGWSSFLQAHDGTTVKNVGTNHGTIHTEMYCATCGSHLDHMSPDASDQLTGMRCCMNSATLTFAPTQ